MKSKSDATSLQTSPSCPEMKEQTRESLSRHNESEELWEVSKTSEIRKGSIKSIINEQLEVCREDMKT